MVTRRDWITEEFVVCLELYKRRGFLVDRDPEVAEIANLCKRTRDSIRLRMGNFAAKDPMNPRTGLEGGGRRVQEIWDLYEGRESALRQDAAAAREHLATIAPTLPEPVAREPKQKEGKVNMQNQRQEPDTTHPAPTKDFDKAIPPYGALWDLMHVELESIRALIQAEIGEAAAVSDTDRIGKANQRLIETNTLAADFATFRTRWDALMEKAPQAEAQRQSVPASATAQTRTRPARGNWIPIADYKPLCEEAIRADGGRTTLERICQIVCAQLESRMGPDDLATNAQGDPRWRINVKLALSALGKEGHIEQDGQRGRWRLCDQASR